MRPNSAKMHRKERLYYGTYYGAYTPGFGTRVGPPVYRRMEMLFGTRVDHMAHPCTQQATGLDAWASRVKCPARFVSHLHDICIYMSCL